MACLPAEPPAEACHSVSNGPPTQPFKPMSQTLTPQPAQETLGELRLETENVKACPICGSSGDPLYEGLTDRLYGVPGQWRLQKCRAEQCGLLWLDPRPTPQDIGKAYAEYFTHDSSSKHRVKPGFLSRISELQGFLRKLWQISSRQKRVRNAADLMYLDGVKPGRLLEIGCGNGRRLVQFRDHGWQVEGQEVIIPPCAALKGPRSANRRLSSFPEPCFPSRPIRPQAHSGKRSSWTWWTRISAIAPDARASGYTRPVSPSCSTPWAAFLA